MEDKGITVQIRDAKSENMLVDTLLSLLPYILLIGVMFFVMRSIGGGGGAKPKPSILEILVPS